MSQEISYQTLRERLVEADIDRQIETEKRVYAHKLWLQSPARVVPRKLHGVAKGSSVPVVASEAPKPPNETRGSKKGVPRGHYKRHTQLSSSKYYQPKPPTQSETNPQPTP